MAALGKRRAVDRNLFWLGVSLLLSAVVGGAVTIAGVALPVLDDWPQRAAVALMGVLVLTLSHRVKVDSTAARPGGSDARGTGDHLDQLPPSSGYFTGREQEIGDIEAALETASIVVLRGGPGVGKTSLAIEVARRLASRRKSGFDHLLFIRFSGTDPSTLTTIAPEDSPRSLLVSLLHDLGATPDAPSMGIEDLSGAMRRALRGRRVFMIVDGIHSEGQVSPFILNDEAGRMLVTTQVQPTFADGRYLTVRPFDPDSGDGERLLRKIIGKNGSSSPEAARAIVEQCDGIPLAIAIAAATLRETAWSHRGMATYAAELADRRRRLDLVSPGDSQGVRASLRLAYDMLPAEAAAAFRRLSVMPVGDFTLEAAQHVLGDTRHRAVVDTLVNAHLLEVREADRYGFHRLVSDFAEERFTEEEPEDVRQLVQDRILDFYFDTFSRIPTDDYDPRGDPDG